MQKPHPSLVEQALSEDEPCLLGPNKTISWSSVGTTHAGRIRYFNEDAYLDLCEQQLWLVADGLGGHDRGDFASKNIVKLFRDFQRKPVLSDSLCDIEARLHEANSRCRSAFKGKRIGSTVAALFESHGRSFCIWAGDSRIYRLRAGKLALLTADHSVAHEKYLKGELSLAQTVNHPSAHVLTRAVGVHRDLKLELVDDSIEAKDRYLLCSDGLYNDLSFKTIEDFLLLDTPSQALDALLNAALNEGGRDNITAIVVDAKASV